MRAVVLLHASAVVGGPQALHPADQNLVSDLVRLGLEVVVVELVGATGVAPCAANDALAAGAGHAVRVVAESLGAADAHATGLVAECALVGLDPDVTVFAPDADPEGVADVPAVIAWRLRAAYIPGVTLIGAPEAEGPPPGAAGARLTAVVVRSGALVRIAIPSKAVLGLEAAAAVSPPADASAGQTAAPAAAARSAIQIVTLRDLGIDEALVRRGHDQRGVVEPTSRPLVTTRSVESLVALLR